MNWVANSLKEVGGIFKFGKGVLGKSAIALGVLLFIAVIAVWRLHSDLAIIGTLLIAALIFFLWFYRVTKFASDHPDIALLEGAEWTGYQRFHATAKGLLSTPPDKEASSLPGVPERSLPPELSKLPDKEINQ